MTHDDQTTDVLAAVARALCDQDPPCQECKAEAAYFLPPLARAGLAVVKVGEPPPWMENLLAAVRALVASPAGGDWRRLVHNDLVAALLELDRLTEGNGR